MLRGFRLTWYWGYLIKLIFALRGFWLVDCISNLGDVLMEQLTNYNAGSYVYMDDQARKLFVDDLTSTLQVIALDAKSRATSARMWSLTTA